MPSQQKLWLPFAWLRCSLAFVEFDMVEHFEALSMAAAPRNAWQAAGWSVSQKKTAQEIWVVLKKTRSKLQSFGFQVFICMYVCTFTFVSIHVYLGMYMSVCVYTCIFTCKPWTSVNAHKFQPVPWSISQYHGFQKTCHSWFIMGGEPSLANKTWFGRIHAHERLLQ